jgi:hypothetical protein
LHVFCAEKPHLDRNTFMRSLPASGWRKKSISLLLGLLLSTVTALAQQSTSNAAVGDFVWERQYYGKLEGVEQLLHTRSFARSQPTLADTDGDGLEDLFVGKADGRIAFFKNLGTPNEPSFRLVTEDYEAFREVLTNDQQLIQVKEVIAVDQNASPEFADIDMDGDLDLFIGAGDGSIFFYENRGNRLLPQYFLKSPIFMNLKFSGNAVPRFADVNGDRLLDLLVGTRDGKVQLFYNSGLSTRPLFCPKFVPGSPPDPRCKYQPQDITDLAPHMDATPTWVDWDQDGLLDLVAGQSNGKLTFLHNQGGVFKPNWVLESSHFLFIDSGGFSAPNFHDLNRDGYPELLLGTASSNMILYENRELLRSGLAKVPGLDLKQIDFRGDIASVLNQACAGIGAAPECVLKMAAAFGLPDTIKTLEDLEAALLSPDASLNSTALTVQSAGDQQNPAPADPAAPPGASATLRIPLQANVNTAPADPNAEQTAPEGPQQIITRNRLWLNTRNFLNIRELAPNDLRVTVTSGDWNGDQLPDLILGGNSGRIYAYENRGKPEEPDWYPLRFPVFEPNQRRISAPFLADLDGDKDLDLVVGNEQGRVEVFRNDGDEKAPKWVMGDVRLSQIDVGNDSRPILADLDGDEDLDLIVGNGRGLLIYYENQGSAQTPRFFLRSTRFASVRMTANASPTFFNWNDDESPDLVTGDRNGTLRVSSFNPRPGTPPTYGWRMEREFWNGLTTVGYSSPNFADLNGDQQPDLLVGDTEGNLLLWINQGRQDTEPPPPEPVLTANSIDATDNPIIPETDEDLDILNLEEDPIDDTPVEPKFTLVTRQFSKIQAGRKLVPALMDLDGDLDLDLVIGNREGRLLLYTNEGGNPESGNWRLTSSNYLNYRGGGSAAPAFVDVDGDGDRDLLIGNEHGSLQFWENRGSDTFPDFMPNPTAVLGVTGGQNSVPTVFDLNGDGFPDLLVGNLFGQLREFEQVRRQDSYRFRLLRRQFMGLDVGLGAVPRFADLNNDKVVEMVIGSDLGRIQTFDYVSGKLGEAAWKPSEKNYFESLELPVGSAPAFADLDEDNDMDLLIGGEDGSLYYYRNDAR